MSDSMIRDYKAEVISVYERLDSLVRELDSSDHLKEIQDIRSETDRSEPSLMFMGSIMQEKVPY